MKIIYFAGGCFWGTEHYFQQFEGIKETMVGYANGNTPNPTYEQVYTDETGYVECVKLVYDPNRISLGTLCRLYFRSINPLLKNRQGNDIGTRYRTGIYWQEEEDIREIEEVYAEKESEYSATLMVEKEPLKCFYPAEEYHQDYLKKKPDGYCHLSLETFRFANTYTLIFKELISYSDDEKKAVLPRFFKTGKGEYGEGDKFIGVIVPNTRKVAKKYKDSSFQVVEALLESEWHECRLCALLILVEKYKKSSQEVVDFYLSHTKGINNWDLVDLSAPYILGKYLEDKTERSIIYRLAESGNMWEQRIAIVSTLSLIRSGQFNDTLSLSEQLMNTSHDLIQKSVGWMLREIGKRDEKVLIAFLEKYRLQMPRTMLRYSIEKFPAQQRKYFLSK